MKIEVFTKGWRDDAGVEDAEDATTTVYSLVKVNGQWLPNVIGAEVKTDNGFGEVTLRMYGAATVTVLGAYDWDQALDEVDDARLLIDGTIPPDRR